MICPKCAMEIHEGSKFCSECGEVLKDLQKENIAVPQVETEEYDEEEEAFFRVEKNGTQEAPQPYDVVPKQKRKPSPIPPKVTAEQVALSQQPKAQELVSPIVREPQVYAPAPQPSSIIPPLVAPQVPSAPPQFQAVVIEHGVATKKKSPNKAMILLGIIVVALAVSIAIMVLNLRKGSSTIKFDRHDGLSTAVDQTKTSSGSGNPQEETVSTPTTTPIEESQEADPAAEALKAKALKEEQLIQDKTAIKNTMNLYYASFIESINVENSDNLVYSTDANKKNVDYKIENPNKGYLFIAQSIIYDLSSIEVAEDEVTGEKTANLNAKFAFDYRKKAETDDDWVNSDNFQKCYFVYDAASESWLVDNTEIDSTIELGDNIELYTFEPA